MCPTWQWTVLPWEVCLASTQAALDIAVQRQLMHHMHVQQVQDVAFVQRRDSGMPVCLFVATVIFASLLIRIN